MDIHTLQTIQNWLQGILDQMEPHGTFIPTGEVIEPSYSDPESLLLMNLIFDIGKMIEREDQAISDYYKKQAEEAYGA